MLDDACAHVFASAPSDEGDYEPSVQGQIKCLRERGSEKDKRPKLAPPTLRATSVIVFPSPPTIMEPWSSLLCVLQHIKAHIKAMPFPNIGPPLGGHHQINKINKSNSWQDWSKTQHKPHGQFQVGIKKIKHIWGHAEINKEANPLSHSGHGRDTDATDSLTTVSFHWCPICGPDFRVQRRKNVGDITKKGCTCPRQKAADRQSLTDILDLEQRAAIQVGEGSFATDLGCDVVYKQISPLFWGVWSGNSRSWSLQNPH